MEPSWTKCPAIVSIMKEVYETAGEIDDKAVMDAIGTNAQAVGNHEICLY